MAAVRSTLFITISSLISCLLFFLQYALVWQSEKWVTADACIKEYSGLCA